MVPLAGNHPQRRTSASACRWLPASTQPSVRPHTWPPSLAFSPWPLARGLLRPLVRNGPDTAKRFLDVLERVRIAQTQVAIAVLAERRAAQARHAGFVHQQVRQCAAVEARAL